MTCLRRCATLPRTASSGCATGRCSGSTVPSPAGICNRWRSCTSRCGPPPMAEGWTAKIRLLCCRTAPAGSTRSRPCSGRGAAPHVECIFSEVTDLQRQRQELLRQNQELLRMNRELRRLSENVQEMTREKEILEFKTRLHDEMGYGLTAVRQCLLQRKDPAELEASLEQMNKAVQLFRKDSETPPEENEWDVFVEDAAQLGVTVALQGPMPRQRQQLLLTIARECITNAVRYAGANRLEITITPQGGGQRWQFENDGPPPADPAITPGGGLTAIQRRVMQAGGTMEVQARPRYRLCVNLPKEETI